ncbi:MAG: polysaccharide biosynthesis tyrosine autokinase [Lentisphaeraceae bacterium]|nr:polysaccharide biosynthesis tyrosine autokinase [Lentisphaeraceae bacterium]
MSNSKNTESFQIDIPAISRVLLAYWWMIILGTITGTLLVFVICQNLPEVYRAETRFEILENKAIQLEGKITEEFRDRNFNPLNRHIVLLEGENINKTLERKYTERFSDLQKTNFSPFDVYAAPVRGAETVMLDVAVDSYNQDAALAYLKELMEVYEGLRLDESQKELSDTRKAFRNEQVRLDTDISLAQAELDDFKVENNFILLETKNDFDRKLIAKLLERANQKEFELEVLKSRLALLNNSEADIKKVFPQLIDSVLALSESDKLRPESSLEADIRQWKDIQVALRKIDAEYKIKLKKYKKSHPKMIDLKDKEEIILAESSAYSVNIVNALRGRVESMEIERLNYLKKANATEKSLGEHSIHLSTHERLKARLTNLIEMKNRVHSKIISLSTDSTQEKYFMRMIRSPEILEKPVWPQKLKSTAAGFIFSFMLSAIFVLSTFMKKAEKYNFSKVIDEKGVACLATIPHFPVSKFKKDKLFLNSVSKGSILSEAYRNLRINIEKKLGGLKSLVVTSSGPGEGKTTTSLNLALCWSWTGQKVLIIDGDFRKASLRKIFPDETDEGILDYLKYQEGDIFDYVVDDVAENLSYLPAGHSEELVTEYLESGKMSELINSLESAYDIIIIDSAPVLRVVDTVHLSDMTAATVVVARSGVSSSTDISRVLDKIAEDKTIGFTVNGFKPSHARFVESNNQTDLHAGYSYGYANLSYKSEY